MTVVEICNLALSKLGCNPIQTFGDTSTAEGIQCAANYTASRDTVLESAEWTFNDGQIQPSQAAGSPLVEFKYAWIIPTNVLSVRSASDVNGHDLQHDWKRAGGFVLTNDTPVYLTVGYKVDDTTSFSAGFCAALATYLAAEMCIALTENNNRETALRAEYQMKFDEAKYIDGKQGSPQSMRPIPLPGRTQSWRSGR